MPPFNFEQRVALFFCFELADNKILPGYLDGLLSLVETVELHNFARLRSEPNRGQDNTYIKLFFF